jgi:dimeric dUTPase (all-alpha-NTP-PPase superfamily)
LVFIETEISVDSKLMTNDSLIAKLRAMLVMQDEMNKRIDADWLEKARSWHRAVWIECGELMEHHGGWKWWKHTDPDVQQVMLEIVDIWHFGLSSRITAARNFDEIAKEMAAEWNRPNESQGFLMDVEDLACVALVEERFEVSVVPVLLKQLDQEFDDLYRTYIGKNVLNVFRQDHGYRDGSYQKTWQGREDNEHLSEIVADLNSEAESFRDEVYRALKDRYALVTS